MLEPAPYLRPTYFLDSDNPAVVEYAHKHSQHDASPEENAVSLYYAVRDDFMYNPYKIDLRPTGLKASDLLNRNYGYCVEKAVLLAAVARVVGIPTRLSFFNVRNHIATEKVERVLQTDLLVFHGCTELWLSGRWVKATPAFNAALCRKLNVPTLEFDGKEDSIFQQFDYSGNVFMDYVHEYGAFHDLPYDLFFGELRKHYSSVINDEQLAKSGLMIDLNALAG
ncbi:MAG: transglutaminase family protein [Ignavibacteria bacterium]|nr:transglutaminase family protein [Ignavibacteria bacterium]